MTPKWGRQLLAVFLLIFIAVFIPAVWGPFVWANTHIVQFRFVTEPQTIRPRELSSALSIQAQDAAGGAATTTETTDLEFSSSSGTGEFLNASGDPVRTVMNRGTANRTFYYRDSAPGTHTLKVKAIARATPPKSWEAVQEIIVSSGESASGPTPSPPAETPSSPAGAASTAAGAPVSQPAEEPPPAVQPAQIGETSLSPPGVREEEPAVIIATGTNMEMPVIASVQVAEPRPPGQESPKPVSPPQALVKPKPLAIASAAAPSASAAAAASPSAYSSKASFFFMLAFVLNGIAAVGFLAAKKFLAGTEMH